MELSKNFIAGEAEAKWYAHWLDKGYFNSTPDEREPYTIVIPPPNVTGVLHMGHCLNNTIQDILIRRARMQGKNACWVPGTDHASIATEAKVVGMLRERGIAKSSLTREEFLAYAWEWKEKYGGIILQQLKKLGCSLDWNRTSFTMDKDYYQSVMKVFVDLHGKGLIYRGKRMVNWDPVSLTALSDEEVIFKEVDSKLYYVKYLLTDKDGQPSGDGAGLTVATTRPETILGDIAICVNPTDERYTNLIGKNVLVPIINRVIPVIADEYVTMDFGTGALKITPAHDKNDNVLGIKHNLKAIDTLDASGKFTAENLMEDKPSELVLSYVGVDRFALRKKIVEDISALQLIEKTEEYKGQVGTSERTGAVIEHRLSLQWFIDMQKFIANNPEILSAVSDDNIAFHPAKLKNTYSHWMGNIKDWCISRQLWWGQQIPAWYDEAGNVYVAESLEALHTNQPATIGMQLKQDEDVLDTWFSSWLWPMEVFKGISHPGNDDIAYYYPSTTLVTGQDILFFWVARMIMAGYEYAGQRPFKDVYFTGMVRDKLGRKMSKQLGNSPDLLALIDNYGADAVRFGIMVSSPAGNDLMFDESALEQGRNFNNKLWNALKLVKMWEARVADNNDTSDPNSFAINWFTNRLNQVKAEVEILMHQFRLSEALKTIYSLIWDDFCSWYLEWVKPGFEQPVEAAVFNTTVAFFEELMQLLHPFMPFVSEEIYHLLRQQSTDLCVTQDAPTIAAAVPVLQQGELLKQVISALRDARNKNQLKPKETIQLHIQTEDSAAFKAIENIISKQVNAAAVFYTNDTVANSIVVAVEQNKFYIESEQKLDSAALKTDLLKDLAHQQGFIASVQKKLSNEKFVQNAKPEVIELERKKLSDAAARIKTIEEGLAGLN
ncbi:valine--tRNA ligase [Ferruginibacter paludis]|uniref:valine--tRNA ligase n=1 Tax=Ferruginibacter paludis TaxID=1310417 RepID=UPI0025B309AA|nr:valine--tRNA ligase [Ferruginibacter paludis]MDN3656477.1 valine--tRNA ligase [Ferruginibacter paludis]